MTATTFFRNYKQLAVMSVMGIIVLSAIFLAVMAVCFVMVVERGAHPEDDSYEVHISSGGSLSGYLSFIGVSFFALCPTLQVIPIQSQMTDRRLFPRIFTRTLVLVGLLYTVLGVLGYLAYGSQTKSDFLLNFPRGGGLTILSILVMLNVVCSYPIALMPCYLGIDAIFHTRKDQNKEPQLRYFVMVRLLVSLLILALAVVLPDFGKTVSLIGGGGTGLIGYFHLLPPSSLIDATSYCP